MSKQKKRRPFSEEVLALTKPISKDSKCGNWIRSAPEYLSILTDKEEDDSTLPMGEWERPLKKANWKKVIQKTEVLLKSETKDLELILVLLQAWTADYDSFGLKQGLYLLTRLTDEYWDDIWPRYTDDDPEDRIRAYRWLSLKGGLHIKKNLSILKRNNIRLNNFTYVDYENSEINNGSLLNNNVKKKGSSVKTSDNFTQIKNNNSILNLRKTLNSEDFEWLILIKQDIESSEVSIKELEKKLDEKLGNRSISFLGLKKDLYDIKLLVEQLSTRFSERKSSQKEKETNHFFSEQQLEKSTCDNGESFSDRPLSKNLTQVDLRRSVDGTYRSQIYKKINELSRELKNLEPHSPTPYLLERLSTWEDMSLNELVSDIAKMDGTLKGLLTNMEKKND